MPETTNGATEIRSALENTHRRLRLLVKRIEGAELPEDQQLLGHLRRSRRQLRQNRREVLGGAKTQGRANGTDAASEPEAEQTEAAKKKAGAAKRSRAGRKT